MNLNIRESNMLTSTAFVEHDDGKVAWLVHVLWMGVGTVPGVILHLSLFAGPLFLPSALLFVTIPLYILLLLLVPRASMLHKAYGIHDQHSYYNSCGHRNRQYALEYLELDKEDRALFPRNLLDILKNPSLTNNQRLYLDAYMRNVFKAIEVRDKQREKLETRHIDIDDVLAELARAKQHVQIEVDTLREFSND